MKCPKCGHVQTHAEECSACGVIIAKYLARASVPAGKRPHQRRKNTRYRFLQKEHELAAFYEAELTMLGAGLNQEDALNRFLESPGRVKDLSPYLQMKASLATGNSVSEAMSHHPDYFPAHHVRLVRAGETAGDPSVMFAELHRIVLQKAEMLQTIATEIRKPVITGLLSFFLLPLPVLVSDGVIAYLAQSLLPLLLLGVIWLLGTKGWRQLMNRQAYALTVDELKCRVGLYRQFVVNQYLTVFTLLYAAGVPVADAFVGAAETTDNRFFKQSLSAGSVALQAGESLTTVMGSASVFDSRTLGIIRTGEASGSLTEALNRHLDNERKQFDLSLKRWTRGLAIAIGTMISLYVGARIVLAFMDTMPDIPV